jgi:hypothetical protein
MCGNGQKSRQNSHNLEKFFMCFQGKIQKKIQKKFKKNSKKIGRRYIDNRTNSSKRLSQIIIHNCWTKMIVNKNWQEMNKNWQELARIGKK